MRGGNEVVAASILKLLLLSVGGFATVALLL